MSKTNRKLRCIILAVVTVVLAVAGTAVSVLFTGCRTLDEPGYAELQAGKADFRAKDYASAVAHFRPAAEQGNATAQVLLGVCYREGNGVEQDDAEAEKWFRMAAEQGNAEAQKALDELGKGE